MSKGRSMLPPTRSRKGERHLRWPSRAAAVALTGCEGVQSAAAPTGESAAAIWDNATIMCTGGVAVFAIVLALSVWEALAPPHRRRWLASRAVVVALSFCGLITAWVIVSSADGDTPAVWVIGEQRRWRVE